MATDRVADMSKQELRDFVEAIVEQRAKSVHPMPYQQKGGRSMKEVLQSMRQSLWTPPPGAKSSVELLREDRDQ
jgi:hypothetical protein